MKQSKFETPRAAFVGGMQAIAPILLGAIPFGLVVGVISAENGLSTLQMIAFSSFVFAGLSQLVAFQLYAEDAALWVIVVSAVMVNLRLLIYSASIASYFKHLSVRWKLFLSYILVDQGYALSIAYYDEYPDAPHKHWYYAGTGALITVGWLTAVVVGFFVGAVIPESWQLSFIVPAMFLGLLVPAIKSWPYLAATVVAATVALLTINMPHNLGLVTAILCGMLTGAVLEREE